MELSFNNDDLKESPSAQLQIVGEMAEGGKCHVAAMGGTILYSVDKNVKAEQYDLKSGLMFKRLNQPLKDAVSGLNENLSNFDVGSKGNIKGITFKISKILSFLQ